MSQVRAGRAVLTFPAVIALGVALAVAPAAAEPPGPSGPSGPGASTSTSTKVSQPRGSLVQLSGRRGCVTDKAARVRGCATARALAGPGPFMGSRALGVSPDGRHVYVASARSKAVTILKRNKRTGALTQARGRSGCISDGGRHGCASAVGLDGANSLAFGVEGRTVFVTARNSNAVTAFVRNRKTGALRQVSGTSGCIAGQTLTGCATGTALSAPDVVVASKDGRSVYVGSFRGNAVAVFRAALSGALSQASGSAACIAEDTVGCAPGVALKAPEGMAISADGANVYVGSAVSNAVAVLDRNRTTGTLTQASDGSGCISNTPLTGCTTGRDLAGANAVALSPNGKSAYVTSLFSNSTTSFTRLSDGALVQKYGIDGCTTDLGGANCRFGRRMVAPEGLEVTPDGRNVYVTSYASGAVEVLDRNRRTGSLLQQEGPTGCVAYRKVGCEQGRALKGASSVAVSPDSRFVYVTAHGSNAVAVFRRLD